MLLLLFTIMHKHDCPEQVYTLCVGAWNSMHQSLAQCSRHALFQAGVAFPHTLLSAVNRAVMVALSAIDEKDLDLDVMSHPLLNIIYYGVVEIIPSAWVLYILRKLPPKRTAQGYQQIPNR